MRINIFFLVLFLWNTIYAQDTLPKKVWKTPSEMKLKGKYELGFTFAFGYYKKYSYSLTDTGFYHFTGIYRLQFGREIFKNQYLDVWGEYALRRTDIPSAIHPFDAFSVGLQYKYKVLQAVYQSKVLNLFGEHCRITCYPEFLVTTGVSNFNTQELKFRKNEKFDLFYGAIGTGLTFYLGKRINFQFGWHVQYFPFYFPDKIKTQLVYKF